MKIKVFNIKLSNESTQNDEDTINNFMENVTVKKTLAELINGQPNSWSILVFYEDENTGKKEEYSEKISVSNENELTNDEKRIYSNLKIWRQDKAKQHGISAYMICHNKELMTIAKFKPQSLDEFLKIKGFGEKKISSYGDDIIALLISI